MRSCQTKGPGYIWGGGLTVYTRGETQSLGMMQHKLIQSGPERSCQNVCVSRENIRQNNNAHSSDHSSVATNVVRSHHCCSLPSLLFVAITAPIQIKSLCASVGIVCLCIVHCALNDGSHDTPSPRQAISDSGEHNHPPYPSRIGTSVALYGHAQAGNIWNGVLGWKYVMLLQNSQCICSCRSDATGVSQEQ